jgi:hypothetical protein
MAGNVNVGHMISRKYCSIFIHILRQVETRIFYQKTFNSNQLIRKLLNVEVSVQRDSEVPGKKCGECIYLLL